MRLRTSSVTPSKRFEKLSRGSLHASGYKPDKEHGAVSLPKSDVDFSSALSRLKDSDIVIAIENMNWKLATETLDFIRAAIIE